MRKFMQNIWVESVLITILTFCPPLLVLLLAYLDDGEFDCFS